MACKYTNQTELSRPRARPDHFVLGVHTYVRKAHMYTNVYKTHTCVYTAHTRRSSKKWATSSSDSVPRLLSVRAESAHKKETGYRIKAIPTIDTGLCVISIPGPGHDDIRGQRYLSEGRIRPDRSPSSIQSLVRVASTDFIHNKIKSNNFE